MEHILFLQELGFLLQEREPSFIFTLISSSTEQHEGEDMQLCASAHPFPRRLLILSFYALMFPFDYGNLNIVY